MTVPARVKHDDGSLELTGSAKVLRRPAIAPLLSEADYEDIAAWQAATKNREDIAHLKALLIQRGGRYFQHDFMLGILFPRGFPALLLRSGVFSSAKGVELRLDKPFECAINVLRLVCQDPTLACAIGMALFRGHWVAHSWGVKPDGGIIDTTMLCSLYFGVARNLSHELAQELVSLAEKPDLGGFVVTGLAQELVARAEEPEEGGTQWQSS